MLVSCHISLHLCTLSAHLKHCMSQILQKKKVCCLLLRSRTLIKLSAIQDSYITGVIMTGDQLLLLLWYPNYVRKSLKGLSQWNNSCSQGHITACAALGIINNEIQWQITSFMIGVHFYHLLHLPRTAMTSSSIYCTSCLWRVCNIFGFMCSQYILTLLTNPILLPPFIVSSCCFP